LPWTRCIAPYINLNKCPIFFCFIFHLIAWKTCSGVQCVGHGDSQVPPGAGGRIHRESQCRCNRPQGKNQEVVSELWS
jgi:hypothetical protein